jgi:aspartate/methionine/tyrosine aminotransferase
VLLPRIEYLDFAGRWFGQVAYDLASSGSAISSAAELGTTVAQDELAARDRFRSALSRRYGVPEAEIVPCVGGSGAFFALVAAATSRGDHVLVESPGYESLIRVPQGLGLEVRRFERRASDGFSLDPERVLAAIGPETRLVVVTDPHNPSGVVASDRSIAELADYLAQRDVWLCVDEVYLELAAPGTTARKLGDNVITCSSATKCWGLPWPRAGWVFVPERLVADVTRVERHVVGLAPASSFAWGERATLGADALLERAARGLAQKRELVDRFVNDSVGALAWTPPHARSLFGWIHDRRGHCSLSRIERGARQRGVLVSPGEFFDAPGWFRLSWSAELEIVQEGLRRLGQVLELGNGG